MGGSSRRRLRSLKRRHDTRRVLKALAHTHRHQIAQIKVRPYTPTPTPPAVEFTNTAVYETNTTTTYRLHPRQHTTHPCDEFPLGATLTAPSALLVRRLAYAANRTILLVKLSPPPPRHSETTRASYQRIYHCTQCLTSPAAYVCNESYDEELLLNPASSSLTVLFRRVCTSIWACHCSS